MSRKLGFGTLSKAAMGSVVSQHTWSREAPRSGHSRVTHALVLLGLSQKPEHLLVREARNQLWADAGAQAGEGITALVWDCTQAGGAEVGGPHGHCTCEHTSPCPALTQGTGSLPVLCRAWGQHSPVPSLGLGQTAALLLEPLPQHLLPGPKFTSLNTQINKRNRLFWGCYL